ncbi:hypothetical protein PR202_ga04760 [Eleusine coracana subsp. coracana]|uniref:DUF3475 domain-containing protein n=1 Tax=Eleusine coracana subsp. coracana TaxID=191504 RepID=A0AAV5BSD3_ELECO|nr:hypothetical protein PR202_ga04760 [Eleusine coracana subsp. coracana]
MGGLCSKVSAVNKSLSDTTLGRNQVADHEAGALEGEKPPVSLEDAEAKRLEEEQQSFSFLESVVPGLAFQGGASAGGAAESRASPRLARSLSQKAGLGKARGGAAKPSIKHLKEVVLGSEGVQNLISKDMDELLKIAAADKREEVEVFTKEVVRFGNRCKDPQWHNLDRYFDKYSSFQPELYHELHALDRFQNDYRTKQKEQDGLTSKGDSLHLLKQEVKGQIKHVKSLQKRSLWSKSLEEMMEKFIDIVHFLYLETYNAFGCAGTEESQEPAKHHNRLGPAGLALHYANIINLIDTILTGTQLKAEMEKTLRWLVPFANNTLKAHHGFGWVGEWANTGSDMDYKLSGQNGLHPY